MRNSYKYHIQYPSHFKQKLYFWAKKWSNFCILNSNGYNNNPYSKYYFIAAFGNNSNSNTSINPFEEIKEFYNCNKDWTFGFFGYDLKNYSENLKSENIDGVKAPDYFFFNPEFVFIINENELQIQYVNCNISAIELMIQEIENTHIIESTVKIGSIKSRISKEQYYKAVSEIKHHIQIGDIYELNFCQEFYAENIELDSATIYQKLNKISPTPFSAFARFDSIDVMCASPERYLMKQNNTLISQPIKGTIKRGTNKEEDEQLKEKLLNSHKDRSENVMIVDLVRNDLSITAEKASVNVDELFGIYEFPQVYQMISTVKSELRNDCHFIDAIKHSFPMGSMTGAPKIRAMELIEKYESFKRGIYSGSIGYIDPEGNFDFNVVIRSIIYNSENKYLSFSAGGAITINSDIEGEYEESMLKAQAIFNILS
ncbi:MAG: anthranilate synthase component I family protein [Bacteroidota bacterium]